VEENETLKILNGEKYKILHGNSIEVLKTLPDESIDCCVTSPPYYALRDYGTGKWVGGDPNCPHYRTSKYSEMTATGHKAMMDNGSPVGDAIYKSVCPLCGAVRVDDQIGLEETPEEYIQKLVDVFREVRRALKKDGTLWVNIGDSYWGSGSRGFDFTDVFTERSKLQQGSKGTVDLTNLPSLKGSENGTYKNKDLIGIPWMLAFALRADGWWLRQDIVWQKPNPMPESVKDRCTKSHEYIFLMGKSQNYYFDNEAIQERAIYAFDNRGERTDSRRGTAMNSINGNTGEFRNKRDVWTVNVGGGYSDDDNAHYATYSEKLIEPCILAGCKQGGIVLDPFSGTGTTGACAMHLGRKYIGIDLSWKYVAMSERRLQRIADQNDLFDLMG
jgi:DNA modification methylase